MFTEHFRKPPPPSRFPTIRHLSHAILTTLSFRFIANISKTVDFRAKQRIFSSIALAMSYNLRVDIIHH